MELPTVVRVVTCTLVFDSGNIVNISGNIFLYPPQGHPILYNYYTTDKYINLKAKKIHGFNSCIVIRVQPIDIPWMKKGTEYHNN